jgi:hypothetical protein
VLTSFWLNTGTVWYAHRFLAKYRYSMICAPLSGWIQVKYDMLTSFWLNTGTVWYAHLFLAKYRYSMICSPLSGWIQVKYAMLTSFWLNTCMMCSPLSG